MQFSMIAKNNNKKKNLVSKVEEDKLAKLQDILHKLSVGIFVRLVIIV